MRVLALLTALAASMVSSASFALEEGSLNTTFQKLAIPYLDSAESKVMVAKDGVKIHYRYFPASTPALGTLVIVNGWTEFMRKYAELVYDLRNTGYAIVIYDHRGQGESDRLIPDPLKSYVNSYKDYVSDLNQLMNEIVRPLANGGDIFMVGHSMGGGIATSYLEQHPGLVKAFVASSPMYGQKIDPSLWGVTSPVDLPPEIALPIMETAVRVGWGENYAPGESASGWKVPFETNRTTTSRNRYDDAMGERIAHPELIVAGATYRWLGEVIKLAMLDCRNAAKLKIPSIIFRAGEEKLVLAAKDDIFAAQAMSQIVEFPGARHEILNETDAIRNRAIATMLDFFNSHGSGAPVAADTQMKTQ